MGAAVHEKIRGRKGGSSKPKQPSIAQDSLQSVAYAKLLLAVGEGEFAEAPTEKDIYLDNTPLMDASGNYNFPNVKWAWRPGTVDQDYIPGIPSVENETTVNVELRSDTPWIRSINNTQLSAVRLRFAWPALQKQDTSGNVTGYRIEYAVDVSADGGAYVEVLNEAVDGKTTSRYERTRRIDLPAATSGWQIRVRRLTANQNSSLIADTMLIAGLTEVIDAKLRYPNTALLYVEFSAEQFSNIPAVTVECRARKVQVPTTYDPIARTYSGVWDGSFKSAWTNNPAWITYDVSTNNRFGLGRRVRPWMVDKWELYKVAQYCDQLVPDGKGGQEPRFLCDLNLQKRADAWQLLRDIAAIYRGMSYWAQGQIVTQADMPRTVDFDYVFTRANVIGGKFSYGGGSARTRYSRALVSYDNPDNNYDTDVTPYSDPALQRRYGDNVVEVSAIGCTRESEAKRRGAWVVLTGVQDRVVNFSTGLEGRIPQPGYIIPVADSLLAGREIGGRISAVVGRVITLDRGTSAKPGDRLIINLPSGVAQARTVQSVSGRAVTVTTAYSETPEPELCWALDADDLALQLYRVLKAKRGDDAWTITGLQYDPSKFDRIDTGARLEDRPISVIPVTTVPAPAEITLTSRWAVDQGLAVSTMTIAWSPVAGAVAYDVEWKKDSGNWIRLPRQGTTSVDITSIYAGAYLARVRAVSAVEVTSIWKVSELKQLVGKDGAPPAVAFLRTAPRVMGIDLEWGFPDGASDTQRTEIWYSTSPSRNAGNPLGDFAYPQNVHTMQGLASGVTFFFWARLVDRTGNVGPWFPEGIGISGQSSVDATELLGYLAGQIGETELGQHLIDRIAVGEGAAAAVEVQQRELAQQAALLSDALAGAAQDLADERDQRSSGQKAQADALQAEIKARQDAVEAVAGDLLQEVLDRKQQVAEVRDGLTDRIAALDAAVSDILGTAEYSADVAVAAGGLVTYSGKLYRAKVAMSPPVPVPTNTQYWTLLGDYTSLGEAVGDLASRMATAETVQAGQAQRLAAVESTSASSASRVSALEQTTASQASTLQQLKTSDTQQSSNIANLQQTTAQQAQAVQELQTTTGSQGAAITSLQQTDAAHAQSLQELQADVQDLEGQTAGQASALQSLDAKVTQHDGALTSQGQAITSLDSRLDGVEGVNDAQAQAITGLTSRVTSAEGALTSQAQSLTSLGSSLDRTALDALYEGEADADLAAATEGTKANASAISGLSTTVEQQGDLLVSQAQSITTLTADVADLESGAAAQSQALQSLETKVTQQGDSLVSQGAAITSLDSRVDGVEGVNDAQAQAIGTLATRVSDAEGVLTSQAQSLTSLGSSLDRTALDGMYSGEADAGLAAAKQDSAAAATAVQSLSTKVEQQGDAIVAQGAAVTALDTRLTAAEGVATGQASALQQLDSKVTQQGDALTAQASSLSQLSAEVDDASAAVQTTQQAVAGLQGGLQAMYSVKLQVTSNGKIYGAGMGIGIENTPSGMQSQVLFQADRFAVINTANGAISTPFVIQSGQVYINSAIIGDSTIGMAKIADALQSTDYIAGQRGWRLTKAGSFELNSTVAGQGRLVMTNQRIEIYDVNGVLRVRLGIW